MPRNSQMVSIVATTAGALLFAVVVYVLMALMGARPLLRRVGPLLAVCVGLFWSDAAMSMMANTVTLSVGVLVLLLPPRLLVGLTLTGAIFAVLFVLAGAWTRLRERGDAHGL